MLNVRLLFTLILLLMPFGILAQNLLPSIGLSSLPADNDPICNITPFYSINYDSVGYQLGETIADFTFYELDGTPTTLSDVLTTTPVLLISGSYTCVRWRNNKDYINNVHNVYSNDLTVLLLYIVEPHPIIDSSPYNPGEWVTSANLNANILYRQPTTYGERKDIAYDMLDSLEYQPKLLLDGPCNEWWYNYGQGPNRSYLINRNGTVFYKKDWLTSETMTPAIDSLLLVNETADHNTPALEVMVSNSVTDQLSLFISGADKSYTFTLFDLRGREVFSTAVVSGNQLLNTEHLPPGPYIYSIVGHNHTTTGKLIVL